ncbi:ADP-ribosylation factor-binding protein GGA1-like [Takifugu flavidus]|uniref:ADP-ribosylation factor-binding protein GGA1 n=2 Tax=Takifugu TaxID=31032 RepID=A0A5C6MYT3_9TELE|nr:ADP-ribosylation factor-binding protein GGA1-like [Takifugu flavidus]TWW58580.1 ADP-ribosylation factor-binding protein GGA1 [Takifugu flavidus]
MAAVPPDEATLESRINKATNPLNKETDWENIKSFCDQLNNEPDGPQLATRLLAHKIQSPQEWEAKQALTVLETCVKNCGKRFCSEVGKFRFLNELIKVVSPKYLGSRAPEPVKKKVLEMLYLWTVTLPEETKIADAYYMLKKQGIVLQDPVLPSDSPLSPPPPPKASSAIFEDEEKSKTLSLLLNSTNPEDLRAANKLIKEMVQEDQKRVEKVSKRANAILEVKESVTLLSQLLQGYSKESCSQSNQELIKDLFQRCEKMRPTLFRLASDTEDNDEALADILQANDSLTQVINQYRQLVQGEDVAADDITTPQPSSALEDLMGLNTSASTAPTSRLQTLTQNTGVSLLDDELASLGLNVTENCVDQDGFQTSDGSQSALPALFPAKIQTQQPPPAGLATAVPKPMEELDLLGKALLQQALPPESQQVKWDKLQPHSRVTLRELQKSNTKAAPAANASTFSSSPVADLSGFPDILSTPSLTAVDPYDSISLADVTVPLESIKPSSLLPVSVFDKHSLRVLFTFARDSPPSRADVLVVIISMLSSAPTPVTNIRFQAAVPKVMRVKLLPPSSTELPAFNPILPPTAVTQILLLANPHKEKVRLRYKLTFNLGDKAHDESGDVDQFPPANTWGKL